MIDELCMMAEELTGMASDNVFNDALSGEDIPAADQWLQDLERLRVTEKDTIEMDISILDSVAAAKEIQNPIPDFQQTTVKVQVDEKLSEKFNLEHIEAFLDLKQNLRADIISQPGMK